MSPAGKKTLLILFGAMAVVLVIAALGSSEDEDQSSAWRGVFRLLSAIGRVL